MPANIFLLFLLVSLSTGLKEFGLEECEKSRACWAFPPECDSAENCHGIMRWHFKQNRLHVELEAKPIVDRADAQWMAIAFSDDVQMGNESVLECQFNGNGGGNGTAAAANAGISYNYFTQNIPLRNASKRMIVDKSFFQNDDKFGCAFTVDYNAELSGDERKLVLKLDGPDWWHVIFAQGPAEKKTLAKQFHLLVLKSDQLVRICEDCSDKFVRVEK